MQIDPSILNPIFQENIERKDQIFFVYNILTNKLEYLNDAFELIWQKSKSVALSSPGHILEDIVKDDRNYLLNKVKTLIKSDENFKIEFKIDVPGNQRKWIQANFYKLRNNEGGALLYGFAEDVTLKKKYELNLLNVNERKNNVLHIIGHDLRSPLENLNKFIQLLEKEYEQQSFRDFNTYLKYMKQACQNGISLIQDLLTLEFIQSDQVDLKKSRIDIVSRIKLIFDTYRLAEKNLSKNFILKTEKEKVFIEADELKFMLIFSNLISNAYKFTKDGGSITVEIKTGDHHLLITVEDDGIGIPERLQPYLFDKFTKARRPGIQGEKPIGLGLNIIKYMVELHDGKIWFESQENVGTKFYVEVPYVDLQEESQ